MTAVGQAPNGGTERPRLLLASTSPRRRALLDAAGIGFALVEPGPEPVGTGSPSQRCEQRARTKAREARVPGPDASRPGPLVLGVDTVVECDGEELGKPADRAAARRTLERLAGRDHLVHTAHCLVVRPGAGMAEKLVSARVRCRSLEAGELERYLDTGEWADKAGGYGIQQSAGAFMTLVEGELDTVIGLSIGAVRELLASLAKSP